MTDKPTSMPIDQVAAEARARMSDQQKIAMLRDTIKALEELRMALVADKQLGRNRYVKAMREVATRALTATKGE